MNGRRHWRRMVATALAVLIAAPGITLGQPGNVPGADPPNGPGLGIQNPTNLRKSVLGYGEGQAIGQNEFWELDCDICIPAALGGAITVVGSLLLTLYAAFFLGNAIASVVDLPFGSLRASILSLSPGLGPALTLGLFEGVVAGAGIVLPYLVPLLVLLAIFEDTGLLPRIAFMVDGILHRVGRHAVFVPVRAMGLVRRVCAHVT